MAIVRVSGASDPRGSLGERDKGTRDGTPGKAFASGRRRSRSSKPITGDS